MVLFVYFFGHAFEEAVDGVILMFGLSDGLSVLFIVEFFDGGWFGEYVFFVLF